MVPDEIRCKQLVELITDYLEGALSPELRRLFEAHLAECDGCTAYLEQMQQTVRLLGAVAPETLAAEERERLLELFHTWNH
jgi:anti-sigma factor RsiW